MKQVHFPSSGKTEQLSQGSEAPEGKEGGRIWGFYWALLSTPHTEKQPKSPVLGRLRWDVGNTGTGNAANSAAPLQGKNKNVYETKQGNLAFPK